MTGVCKFIWSTNVLYMYKCSHIRTHGYWGLIGGHVSWVHPVGLVHRNDRRSQFIYKCAYIRTHGYSSWVPPQSVTPPPRCRLNSRHIQVKPEPKSKAWTLVKHVAGTSVKHVEALEKALKPKVPKLMPVVTKLKEKIWAFLWIFLKLLSMFTSRLDRILVDVDLQKTAALHSRQHTSAYVSRCWSAKYCRVTFECARSASVCSTAYVYTEAYVYTYTVLHTLRMQSWGKGRMWMGSGAGLGKHAVCGPNKRPDFTIRNSKVQKRG
jgi:hypothetical protein